MNRIELVKEALKLFSNLTIIQVTEDENYPKYIIEINEKNAPPIPIMTVIDKIKENTVGLSIGLDSCPFICASVILSIREKVSVDLLLPHYYSPLKNETFFGTNAYREKINYEDHKNEFLKGLAETVDAVKTNPQDLKSSRILH